jgi:hypothetical protein
VVVLLHVPLGALGVDGSERTVRRAVAEVKANHRRGRRRVYRPWDRTMPTLIGCLDRAMRAW